MSTPDREAFEKWHLEYRKSTWRPLKSDHRYGQPMPEHWNIYATREMQIAWDASAERILEQDRRDAARYRWLRDVASSTEWEQIAWSDQDVDAAIDYKIQSDNQDRGKPVGA